MCCVLLSEIRMLPKSTNLWLAQSFRVQATFSLVILRAEVCRLQAKQERLSRFHTMFTPPASQIKKKKRTKFFLISTKFLLYKPNLQCYFFFFLFLHRSASRRKIPSHELLRIQGPKNNNNLPVVAVLSVFNCLQQKLSLLLLN